MSKQFFGKSSKLTAQVQIDNTNATFILTLRLSKAEIFHFFNFLTLFEAVWKGLKKPVFAEMGDKNLEVLLINFSTTGYTKVR